MDDEVTIPRSQLERLLEAEMKLEALEAAGVDNWSGFEHAMEILQEMRDE